MLNLFEEIEKTQEEMDKVIEQRETFLADSKKRHEELNEAIKSLQDIIDDDTVDTIKNDHTTCDGTDDEHFDSALTNEINKISDELDELLNETSEW